LDDIKAAMVNHRKKDFVQLKSCRALSHLAFNKEIVDSIVKIGLVEDIKQALIDHPSSSQVQSAALLALANLGQGEVKKD